MDVLTDGYALPVSGGLYPPPPYLYRHATAIIASYEADPAAIAGLLPPGVSALEDPPVCLAWVVHYPFSTLGVYNEAIMLVRVSFEGEPYTFCPFIYVDNDAALACGRELWGFPKKFASMGFARPAAGEPFGEQMMFTVERPAGKRLLTVTMNPERPAAAGEVSFLPALTLRRIPNSRLGASQPSICELIRTDYSAVPVAGADGTPELWAGRCSVTMAICLILEELGWGDAGVASSLGVSMFARWMAASFGNQHLLELTPGDKIGCWATTEPGHGSDQLDPSRQTFDPRGDYGGPDCVATLSPDQVVINGRKADWISNGTIADVCVLYCAADTGRGPDPQRGCVVIVPMDTPGVSRGAPLDKLGQRALNQGAVIFDHVVLPVSNVLAGPDDYLRAAYQVLSIGNACMGAIFAGTARAAYELALEYARERRQGGVPIAAHQSVAYRLFHMYRKVEAARALARRAMLYNFTQPVPALQAAMASKVTGTQAAFEIASDALQIFCGAGIRRDRPIEKIFRDARLSMIEDGCNEILAIKGGRYLADGDGV